MTTTHIRIIDIETTGVDPEADRIIEIGAYDLTLSSGFILPVLDRLVNPGRPIPPAASAVHHIMDRDVATSPEFRDVLPALLIPPRAVWAAHSCEFEKSFLPTPDGTEWLCTYKGALRAWPEAPAHNNQALRYWLGFDNDPSFGRLLATPAHRARPDAYVTAWVLTSLLAKHDLETLLNWTEEPKLYPTLSFGKHRGAKWIDVPADYLDWLSTGKHDMDQDWRHGARIELARRSKSQVADGKRLV